ncbi:MAG: SPOR domain-containing protein, partial [Gammaproteobacteria bacterium]
LQAPCAMDPQLKQRLVGAAVLVALAVIFIPSLFDVTPQRTSAAIPRDLAPMPVDQFPEPPPILDPEIAREIDQGLDAAVETLASRVVPAAGPVTDLTALGVGSLSSPNTTGTARPASVPPSMDADEKDGSVRVVNGDWIIQLGSFANEHNAQGLLAKLKGAGFAAFLSPLRSAEKTAYRVRIGPTATREDAERLHTRLAQTLGYAGMIVRNE